MDVSKSNYIETGAYFNGRIMNQIYAYFTLSVLQYQQLFQMILWCIILQNFNIQQRLLCEILFF